MSAKKTSDLVAAFRNVPVLRSRELTAMGFTRQTIANASRAGVIRRLGRGLYSASDPANSQMLPYASVARTAPKAVFCLLSACKLHGLIAEEPKEIWIAIGPNAWAPRITAARTRVVRFTGAALTSGLETHHSEGVDLKIYSVAKTVADMFRARKRVGLRSAIGALRTALTSNKCTVKQIQNFARIRGVTGAVRPYLDAYTAQQL